MTAQELVQQAFDRLAQRSGYEKRQDQVQLSLLLSDLIEQGSTGLFEAPTGLGKSLAALIPAVANAIANDKRTVIATYTNVLADQYWRKDLPLALSLFDEHVESAFLVGRQRYVCLLGMEEALPNERERFQSEAELGTESEFRRLIRKQDRDLNRLWPRVQVPPVCPAKACPAYDDCFYYNARKKLEKAKVVITNHSVVITDALSSDPEAGREGMLFKYDYLLLDEAHDFPSAATNGLEFELSASRLTSLLGIANRLEAMVQPLASNHGDEHEWMGRVEGLRQELAVANTEITSLGMAMVQGGIVAVAPAEIDEHPAVQKINAKQHAEAVEALATRVQTACEQLAYDVQLRLERYRTEGRATDTKMVIESTRNYISYIRDFAAGAHELSRPSEASVSYIGNQFQNVILRRDLIDLQEPLRGLLWNRVPYSCLSATLQVDNEFDHFERVTGTQTMFKEVLPSPYDYSLQSTLYLPKAGAIPDPTQSREGEAEQIYYMAIARELSNIIQICDGRTLALFHSRKEMEGVRRYMTTPDDLPILMQGKMGVSTVGEQFKTNIYASLFALRSFWTGFDAPGETCSCVALVRIPFEVPFEPSQVARMAYLAQQGHDPFQFHTLPNAKIIMRQGAGRLIRSENDKGVIALLDPRLRTKRYGEQILGNFPDGIRTYDDFADAAGWIGIGG
jgi:ATP-dependent DNA helicase DinG